MRILNLTLAIIFFMSNAFAGLPPTTLSGMSQTTKPTTFNFKTPNFQSTQISGTTSMVETGSLNVLPNPGAEGSSSVPFTVSNTGTAACSVVRSTAQSNSGLGSYLITMNTGLVGSCDISLSTSLLKATSIFKFFKLEGATAGAAPILSIGYGQNGTPISSTFSSYDTGSTSWEADQISGIVPGSTSTEVIFRAEPSGLLGSITFYIDDLDFGADRNEGILANVANVLQSSYLVQSAVFSNATITGNLSETEGSGVYSYNSSTGEYTFIRDALVTVVASMRNQSTGNTSPYIFINGVGRNITTGSTINTSWATVTYTGVVKPGDVIDVRNGSSNNTDTQRISVSASASNPNAIFSTETFSTDTNPLFFKSTACLDSEIGCFNTWSFTANSNTMALCATAPSQTVGDMQANGILITARAYNAASTCAAPSRIEVVIGKGFKTPVPFTLFRDSGKLNTGNIDWSWNSVNNSEFGATSYSYDPTTGFATFDAGLVRSAATTNHIFQYQRSGSIATGYLVIEASKTPSLAAFDLSGVANTQSVLFGSGSDCQSVCSTGTCNICSRVGNKITSVTFVSTGNYNVNGIDGTKYICSGNGIGTNFVSAYHRYNLSDTSKAYMIFGYQSAGQNVGSATLNCVGSP